MRKQSKFLRNLLLSLPDDVIWLQGPREIDKWYRQMIEKYGRERATEIFALLDGPLLRTLKASIPELYREVEEIAQEKGCLFETALDILQDEVYKDGICLSKLPPEIRVGTPEYQAWVACQRKKGGQR